MRLAVLVVSGACAGLAGLLYAGRLQSARYTLGESDLMTVIAAVIVGGTALNGGRGTIPGALVGSLMMGMLSNGLILMGLSVSWQMIIKGLIVLAAVAVSLREPNR
jgi:ribose transport system permease protein